ncbi:hypothetical protein DL991_21180 [Amycolatopsis sp. WAC 01375]|nr:hypothetical protein DL991_21180 [Amycolatopsis sp. WAC 01375]
MVTTPGPSGLVEQVGQQRRGKLSGQIDQRGVAAQPRPDAQPVQPPHELPGADRAAGCASRQEPGRLHRAAHDSASVATVDKVHHQRVRGDGFGKLTPAVTVLRSDGHLAIAALVWVMQPAAWIFERYWWLPLVVDSRCPPFGGVAARNS